MYFSRAQLLFVLILYIGISNHVLILPHLLTTGRRDAWICVLIAYVFLLGWGLILHLIMKKNQQRLRLSDWIEARAGSLISRLLISVLMAFVFAISKISFYDLIQSVQIYFLPRTPAFVVMVPFLLISAWSAYNGLKSIVYVSAVLLPIVWLLGMFVALFTFPEKDYSDLFPVLEYISHVDFLAVFQLLSGEIIRVALGLYLLGNMIKNKTQPSKRKHVFVVSTLLLGFLSLLPLSDIWVQTMVGKYFYPLAFLFAVFISLVLFIISYLPMKKGTQNL